VLLAMIRSKDTAARRILDTFKAQRGIDMERLERSVQLAVETRRDVDGDLQFATPSGELIGLGRQMIIALDEALSVAQAGGDTFVDTDHLLAVMAESKLSTGGLLRQFGITPSAMTDLMAGKAVARQSATTTDVVANVKKGSLRAVYFRENLLRDLVN